MGNFKTRYINSDSEKDLKTEFTFVLQQIVELRVGDPSIFSNDLPVDEDVVYRLERFMSN
ncbi:Uncharacterized protein DAT39_023039, partial [Clarias magur]